MDDNPELGFPPWYWETLKEEISPVARHSPSDPETPENKLSDSKGKGKVAANPENQTDIPSENEASDDAASINEQEEEQMNRPRGYVRPANEVHVSPSGQLQWRRNLGDPWINAVRHSTIRDTLIAEANQLGTYKYPRAKGKYWANDVTCFHPDQKDWGKNRDNWPEIVLQYLPGPEYKSQKKAEYWFTREGLLIIDVHNVPVLNYPGIPHTLSSLTEPVFMEAYCRLGKNITQADLRARMVDSPKGGQYNGQGKDPIRLGNLSMRMTRFRLQAGCIAWGARKGEGSENFKKYMDRKLPQHCKDANSIKGFRNLHRYEIAEMKLDNAGMFLERARRSQSGPKDLSADKNRALYRKAHQEFRLLKSKFEAAEALKAKRQDQAKSKPDLQSSDEESEDSLSEEAGPAGESPSKIGPQEAKLQSSRDKSTIGKSKAVEEDQLEDTESSEADMESGEEDIEIGNDDEGVASGAEDDQEAEEEGIVNESEDESSDDEMEE